LALWAYELTLGLLVSTHVIVIRKASFV